MTYESRRYELLARRKRETLQAIEQLDRGELWHPLTEVEYREHLNATLADIDEEMEELEMEAGQ